MKITITGRKVNLRDSFKEKVEKKLSRFNKFFGAEAEAAVTVSLEKNRHTVEITIKHGGMFYRSENTSLDMDESLELVIDKLSSQIRKNKAKLERKVRGADFSVLNLPSEQETDIEDGKAYEIVRSKTFPVKPMDTQEAILQMNMLGHKFFMFRNTEDNNINVVYLRRDGDYGIIIPE